MFGFQQFELFWILTEAKSKLAECPAMSFVLVCWQQIKIQMQISWVANSTNRRQDGRTFCQLDEATRLHNRAVHPHISLAGSHLLIILLIGMARVTFWPGDLCFLSLSLGWQCNGDNHQVDETDFDLKNEHEWTKKWPFQQKFWSVGKCVNSMFLTICW